MLTTFVEMPTHLWAGADSCLPWGKQSQSLTMFKWNMQNSEGKRAFPQVSQDHNSYPKYDSGSGVPWGNLGQRSSTRRPEGGDGAVSESFSEEHSTEGWPVSILSTPQIQIPHRCYCQQSIYSVCLCAYWRFTTFSKVLLVDFPLSW